MLMHITLVPDSGLENTGCRVLRNMDEECNKKIRDEKHKKIMLLTLERDALDNKIFAGAFKRRVSGQLKELSKNQPVVIKIIGMEGEIMPSTLGRYIGMEKSSLTRMVDDLEKKGLVYRKTDPNDRRKVLVSLTEKGKDCYEHLNRITEEMTIEVLKAVDKKDIEKYEKSLEAVVKFLRKIDTVLSK